MSEGQSWGIGGGVGFICLCLFVWLVMWGCPQYAVYEQTLTGTAKLERAGQERQILVEQAKAEVESAKLRAEAIEIVGKSAQEYPEYRLQEFMGAFAEALQNDSIDQIIYVPTEANIPIIEATRMQ
jgi:regulator of protease activity HflC (stomatin/prohibitin superfamily)